MLTMCHKVRGSGGWGPPGRPAHAVAPGKMATMPLDILLVAVSQRGTSPRRQTRTTLAAACDDDGELVRWCASSGRPMLAKIDPYGDLVLTSSEMEQLIDELRASGAGPHETARRIIDETLELASRCAADPTTELWFAGD